jgi:hypothetical protein
MLLATGKRAHGDADGGDEHYHKDAAHQPRGVGREDVDQNVSDGEELEHHPSQCIGDCDTILCPSQIEKDDDPYRDEHPQQVGQAMC